MAKRTRQIATGAMKVTRKPFHTSERMSLYSARMDYFHLYKFVNQTLPVHANCKQCNYTIGDGTYTGTPSYISVDVDILIGMHKEIFTNYYHTECAKRIGWIEFDEQ